MEMSSLSTEYVEIPVIFTVGGAVQDPRGDTVQLAFPAYGVDPVGGDWVTGSWEPVGPPYVARALVGPGSSKVLSKGSYDVWVKVADNPETPAKKAGFLKMF